MRRRRRRSRVVIPLIILIVAAAAVWWYWPRGDAGALAQRNHAADQSLRADTGERTDAAVPEAVIAAGAVTGEVLTPTGPGGGSPAAPDSPGGEAAGSESSADELEPAQAAETGSGRPPGAERNTGRGSSRNPRIDASLQRYQAGQVIAARQELNRMLVISRNAAERAELRRHLEKIADETIFSKQWRPDDPLTASYTIQPGDVLINVGRQFDVPHEIIMMINGIEDATRIRAGQKLKVPRGPFHAKIYNSKFRLDVYLQDLFVRSFPVGLGLDRGTPVGTWKVKQRLTNPTYYPPASAEVKRIIPADDPTNPLGEYWIGLEGIAGDAAGREGYGIHGTIEPKSIGKPVSLGCVRMHNHDVAFLFRLMMKDRSTVTTLP